MIYGNPIIDIDKQDEMVQPRLSADGDVLGSYCARQKDTGQVIPVLQALILCERIYETVNGQKVIAGTFNLVTIGDSANSVTTESDVHGNQVKAVRGGQAGSIHVYISLTDVCDKTKLELQFVSLTSNKVLFGQSLQIDCKDRLETVEIVSALPPLSIPEPGVYAFEVVCEGEVIGSHRIIAKRQE